MQDLRLLFKVNTMYLYQCFWKCAACRQQVYPLRFTSFSSLWLIWLNLWSDNNVTVLVWELFPSLLKWLPSRSFLNFTRFFLLFIIHLTKLPHNTLWPRIHRAVAQTVKKKADSADGHCKRPSPAITKNFFLTRYTWVLSLLSMVFSNLVLFLFVSHFPFWGDL